MTTPGALSRVGRRVCAAALLALPATARAQGEPPPVWAGFYLPDTLAYWQREMRPGVEENFWQVLWARVDAEERRRIGAVALAFPLEDATHPMNFYAADDGRRHVITMPISSMRFFGDVALAYAWLGTTGRGLDPLTDYLAMLKYQWPDRLSGRRYRPREALGVPPDATSDARVAERFDGLFKTAIYFVLAHELGHVYYGHRPAEGRPAQSRAQEEEADRFAMEMMRRVRVAPVGMVPFFTALRVLEPYADERDAARRAASTHPLTGSRLRAIADRLDATSADFVRGGSTPRALASLARDIRTIAANVEDPGLQRLLRRRGLSANPDALGRAPGRGAGVAGAGVAGAGVAGAGGTGRFGGAFRGVWRDTKGGSVNVTLTLAAAAERVVGQYTYEGGTVTLTGTARGDTLWVDWRTGADVGKGVLTLDPSGRRLTGTWGYARASTGAGTWDLRRRE